MAGFRQRVPALVDIAMIAHPSVTLIVDLSEAGGIVYDAHGRRQRGSFVAGLLPGQLRAGGWSGECLQIRLSPVVAPIPLRIIASDRLGHRSGPTGGASRARRMNGWGRSASRLGPVLSSARDPTRPGRGSASAVAT